MAYPVNCIKCAVPINQITGRTKTKHSLGIVYVLRSLCYIVWDPTERTLVGVMYIENSVSRKTAIKFNILQRLQCNICQVILFNDQF